MLALQKFTITMLLLSVAAQAQDLPEAPKPRQKTFTVELALAGAAISADGYSSYKISGEINPVARPFVSSTAGTAAYFGGSFAVLLYGNRLLRNHPRMRHLMNWSVIAGESAWAAHNLTRSVYHIRQQIPASPLPPTSCSVAKCGSGL